MSSLTSSTLRYVGSERSRPLDRRWDTVSVFCLSGCNAGPGGADVQGPVHRQRRHVETEEKPGGPCERQVHLNAACAVVFTFAVLWFLPGEHMCLRDPEG